MKTAASSFFPHSFWDAVILTAADEDQAKAFRSQIQAKVDAQHIPPCRWAFYFGPADFTCDPSVSQTLHEYLIRYTVIADPPGTKIGNGGATMHALDHFEQSCTEAELDQCKRAVYSRSCLNTCTSVSFTISPAFFTHTFNRPRENLAHSCRRLQQAPSQRQRSGQDIRCIAPRLVSGHKAVPFSCHAFGNNTCVNLFCAAGQPVFQMLEEKMAMYLPCLERMQPGVGCGTHLECAHRPTGLIAAFFLKILLCPGLCDVRR